jgi:excisionase family DNA binding protein
MTNLALHEAAQRLGVSPHTLRTWAVYQHRVPFLRLGRRLLFSLADLEAFERASRVEARPNFGRSARNLAR